MLLFSATYDAKVMKFAQAIVSNAVTIRLRREEESLDNIKQFFISCNSRDDKFRALSNIYGSITIGQTMIFCHVSVNSNNIYPGAPRTRVTVFPVPFRQHHWQRWA